MARMKIEVQVPAGQDVEVARALTRLRVARQICLVEETLLPAPNPDFITDTAPNDSTVDRILTTWWEFHQ